MVTSVITLIALIIVGIGVGILGILMNIGDY